MEGRVGECNGQGAGAQRARAEGGTHRIEGRGRMVVGYRYIVLPIIQ